MGFILRLDKYISSGGYYKRSEIKELIKNNRILVNGKFPKSSSEHINQNDEVFIDNNKIIYKEFYYYMLNKPTGYLSATKDEIYNDKTVIDLLEPRLRDIGLFPVGRLDKDTEGLMIISNNGKFAHNTLSPKKHISKKYFAKIYGLINQENINQFKNGIIIDSHKCKPAFLELISEDTNNFISEIYLTITEGKFHQVKRMFLAIEKEVFYLKRVSFAELTLDDNLQKGEYRELDKDEMLKIEQYL